MHTFHKLLILFIFSFLVSGLVDAYYPQFEMESATVHGLFIAFMLYALCDSHSRKHNITAPKGSKILCAVLAPVGIPYYSLEGFGFKYGFSKINKAILFGLFSFGLYFGAYYAATSIHS